MNVKARVNGNDLEIDGDLGREVKTAKATLLWEPGDYDTVQLDVAGNTISGLFEMKPMIETQPITIDVTFPDETNQPFSLESRNDLGTTWHDLTPQ